MNRRLPARIGLWAAAGESFFSLVYVVGLVLLIGAALSRESAADLAAQQWAGIETYAQHYFDDAFSLTVGLIVQVSAFASGILILVVFLALHELADPDRRILTRIASALALIMAVTSSLGYYIQLASVHQILRSGGDLDGLAQFAESNVQSPAMATLQLGWAFFYGLATLVMAGALGRERIDRWIRGGFVANGVIGVTVGAAYALGATALLPLALLGLVGSSFAYPLLAVRFARASRTA